MMRAYVGVDPGCMGALVALTDQGSLIEAWPLPIVGPPKKRFLEVHAFDAKIAVLASLHECHVAVEELVAMPGRGAIGAMSSGVLFGTMLGILQLNNLPIEMVRPKSWQKLIGGLPSRGSMQGFTEKEKKRDAARHRVKLKETLALKAGLACPELQRQGITDGIADAFFIAQYALRKLQPQILV